MTDNKGKGRSLLPHPKVEWILSKRYPILSGVPQGSVLGPLLFIITISNLQNINNHTKIVYADDTTCVVVAEDSTELQTKTEDAMVDLIRYYHRARLKLNAEKMEVVNHDFKNNVVSIKVDEHSGAQQQSVQHARLLGIQIDTTLISEYISIM